jgi:hypothetical protein
MEKGLELLPSFVHNVTQVTFHSWSKCQGQFPGEQELAQVILKIQFNDAR